MTFRVGEPRPENAGRKAGSPNKRSQQLLELAHEHGADPFMFLVNVMLGNKEAFGEDEKHIEFHTRMEAAKELMPYLYGKRKPVDSNGDDSNDLLSVIVNEINAHK